MTESTVVQTDLADSEAAGTVLGRQMAAAFGGEAPDAVILFASPVYDYTVLLNALHRECAPKILVGCSSAGEFAGATPSGSSACGVAIRSTDIGFGVGLGRGLKEDRLHAVKEMVGTFRGLSDSTYHYRTVLLLTDALAGYTEEFLEHLTLETAGRYQVFGGGAGDDAKFSRTHIFRGAEAVTDAAVALEMLSNKPFGIGVSHGWTPASTAMVVTEADGMRLVSLNATPAVEVFRDHAEDNGQVFNDAEPLPFFLHNILGIETPGGYKLRVPLSAEADGSIVCAAEIPAGCTVRIMKASSTSAGDAADRATKHAMRQVRTDGAPALALFFDCAATRLRMGKDFGSELTRVADELGNIQFAGCNTYGQIARIDGQFSGFHNCTAVICIIPE
ncbi:MAG: FIST N-terminal domain-containing protein [Bryobacteraceae bacterium]